MIDDFIREWSPRIDHWIQERFNQPQPAYLYDPIFYTVGNSGKKIRPMLSLIASVDQNGDMDNAIRCAAGLELFHIFSLVHDDIMDHDEFRRGLPTVHTKWDVPTAILAGDGLIAMSMICFSEISSDYYPEIQRIYTQLVLDVCEGQALDKMYESTDRITIDDYLEMIRLKTARLIGASLQLGALTTNAHPEQAESLYVLGESIGMAFQVQDDILDLYAEAETFGKDVGSDIVNRKKSVLTVLSDADQPLPDITESPSREAYIEMTKQMLRDSGVLDRAVSLKNRYTETALAHVASLKLDASKRRIQSLIERLNNRIS